MTNEQSGGPQPPGPKPYTNLQQFLARVQGCYYVVTGFWPLLSMRTFVAITGPKRDLWLVRTAGILIGVIGTVLVLAGRRPRVEGEIPVLAVEAAAGLAGIDVVYAGRGRISPIYLLDALAESALATAWLISILSKPAPNQD